MSDGPSDGPSVADRLGYLVRTSSRWVVAIVLLVVALVVGVSWTFGLFSSSTANPKNTISAGSMSQDNSADNTAIMGAGDMLPGDRVEGSATIENVGDAEGRFTLRVKEVDDRPGPSGGALSSWLRLTVYDEAQSEAIWSGTLDQLDVDLGTWSPGESRSYRFVVTFPQAGTAVDNTYQRSRVTAAFEWHAVQAH